MGKAQTPKTDAPAASSSAGKPAETPAPASEPGKFRQEQKSGAETRLAEVLADLKTAGLTPAELKTFKREARAAAASETDVKPASSPAPKQPEGLKPPVKPDFANWTGSWPELEAAKDKYYEDLTDYKSAKAIQDFRDGETARVAMAKATSDVAAAQERYGAESGKTIVETAQALGFGTPEQQAASEIPGTIKALIDQSSVMVDLLYTLGEKPEAFQEFLALAKSNPGGAIRKLVVMEGLVIDELAKGAKPAAAAASAAGAETGARGEDGRFLAPPAPAKTASKAPRPPAEVSGHATPPADSVEAAFASGNPTAFFDAANRRDLAARKR
jgi:hypothetical protein